MRVDYKLTHHDNPALVWCETETYYEVENLTTAAEQFTETIWLASPPAGIATPRCPITLAEARIPDREGYKYVASDIELVPRDQGHSWHKTVSIPGRKTARFWSTTTQILLA